MPLKNGGTRAARFASLENPSAARRVLVVDDSISRGVSMARVREQLSACSYGAEILYCAIFARPGMQDCIDIAFEIVPHPRIFEWNLFHHSFLSTCCVEMENVLCPAQSFITQGYDLLEDAPALFVPSHRIGHIVTTRPERFRRQTVAWLERNSIDFGELYMMDRADIPAGMETSTASAFKADVYHKVGKSLLFVESDAAQASEIAHRSGKPVLCLSDQELHHPGPSIRLFRKKGRSALGRLARRLGLLGHPVVR